MLITWPLNQWSYLKYWRWLIIKFVKKSLELLWIWRSKSCLIYLRLDDKAVKSESKTIKISLTWTQSTQTQPNIWDWRLTQYFLIITSCRFQWHLFFPLFPTLPLMCILWRDAFLHNWKVPATNLAASDSRRPFSASVPTFIPEELPSLSSTA